MASKVQQERHGMTAAETVKRFLVMLFGMFVTALGLAICVEADLGISPLTTLAYTLHNVVPTISLGTFTFLQHLMFFALMVLVLRRDFRPYQLLQIPCSFLFGKFLDFWEYLLGNCAPSSYAACFILLMLGCVVVALGFSLIFTSRVPLEANTAFLNAVSMRIQKPYGTLKLISDVIIVCIAAAVGLLFLHKIVGIREGTVIAALIIGPIAGFFNRYLAKMERFFVSPAKNHK